MSEHVIPPPCTDLAILDHPHVMYIVGRRQTGKSFMITNEIGDGESTLVVCETDHDVTHHKLHSPIAIMSMRDTLDSLIGFNIIVLDNVIFNSTDRLLQDAISLHVKTGTRLIVAVSHPFSIPADGDGIIIQLSEYKDSCGVQCLNKLKAKYEFQLAANVLNRNKMHTPPRKRRSPFHLFPPAERPGATEGEPPQRSPRGTEGDRMGAHTSHQPVDTLHLHQ